MYTHTDTYVQMHSSPGEIQNQPTGMHHSSITLASQGLAAAAAAATAAAVAGGWSSSSPPLLACNLHASGTGWRPPSWGRPRQHRPRQHRHQQLQQQAEGDGCVVGQVWEAHV